MSEQRIQSSGSEVKHLTYADQHGTLLKTKQLEDREIWVVKWQGTKYWRGIGMSHGYARSHITVYSGKSEQTGMDLFKFVGEELVDFER